MARIDDTAFNPLKKNRTTLVLADHRWNDLEGASRRLFMGILQIMNKKNEFRTSKYDKAGLIKSADISLSSFNRGMTILANRGFIAKKMRGYYVVNPRLAYKCKDAGYFFIEADLVFYDNGTFEYKPKVNVKPGDDLEVSGEF
jgi:hypothetical protein